MTGDAIKYRKLIRSMRIAIAERQKLSPFFYNPNLKGYVELKAKAKVNKSILKELNTYNSTYNMISVESEIRSMFSEYIIGEANQYIFDYLISNSKIVSPRIVLLEKMMGGMVVSNLNKLKTFLTINLNKEENCYFFCSHDMFALLSDLSDTPYSGNTHSYAMGLRKEGVDNRNNRIFLAPYLASGYIIIIRDISEISYNMIIEGRGNLIRIYIPKDIKAYCVYFHMPIK